jgi:hypothetical protein
MRYLPGGVCCLSFHLRRYCADSVYNDTVCPVRSARTSRWWRVRWSDGGGDCLPSDQLGHRVCRSCSREDEDCIRILHYEY